MSEFIANITPQRADLFWIDRASRAELYKHGPATEDGLMITGCSMREPYSVHRFENLEPDTAYEVVIRRRSGDTHLSFKTKKQWDSIPPVQRIAGTVSGMDNYLVKGETSQGLVAAWCSEDDGSFVLNYYGEFRLLRVEVVY